MSRQPFGLRSNSPLAQSKSGFTLHNDRSCRGCYCLRYRNACEGRAGMGLLRGLPRGVDSAIPLLLVGLALLIVQLTFGQEFKELLKKCTTRCGLHPLGRSSTHAAKIRLSVKLGNLVVALYVLDACLGHSRTRLNPLSKRGRFAGTSAGPPTIDPSQCCARIKADSD